MNNALNREQLQDYHELSISNNDFVIPTSALPALGPDDVGGTQANPMTDVERSHNFPFGNTEVIYISPTKTGRRITDDDVRDDHVDSRE